MKKLISLILIFSVLTACFAGCKKKKNEAPDGPTTPSSSQGSGGTSARTTVTEEEGHLVEREPLRWLQCQCHQARYPMAGRASVTAQGGHSSLSGGQEGGGCLDQGRLYRAGRIPALVGQAFVCRGSLVGTAAYG